MKNIKYLVLALLIFHSINIFSQKEELPDLGFVGFMPEVSKVHTGGHIHLQLIATSGKDTTDQSNTKFDNWLVNGKSDPEHLFVDGENVIYSPGNSVPSQNPVTISCDFKRKPGETQLTFIGYVQVLDNGSGFTLDGNYYPVKPVLGVYSSSTGKTALTFQEGTIGVSIVFVGNSAGNYKFSDVNAVGINTTGNGLASADVNANPTEGIIEVTTYDVKTGKVTANILGTVTDGNGAAHIIDGTFEIPKIIIAP